MTIRYNLLRVFIGLMLSCSVNAAQTNDAKTNGYQIYQTLHVSISDYTDNNCIRLNVYHPYGKLVGGKTFPYEIFKDYTAAFILSEGIATGPDVTLTYKCGTETFKVRAWQSQCWLAYGCDAHGEIISHTDGLTLDDPVDTKNASRAWNEFGEVHFTVRNK